MKQYSFSQVDLKFLTPLEATRMALETQIKAYIFNTVMPRIGAKGAVKYDIFSGTFTIEEEKKEEVKEGEKKNEGNPSPEKPKE